MEWEERPPTDQPVLRLIARQQDANSRGDMFGGWIMSQLDLAGAIATHDAIEGDVATVAVKGMRFYKPIYVGALIECYAKVTAIGRTSITTTIGAFARYREEESTWLRVATAEIVYVCIAGLGRPRAIQAVKRSE